MKFEEALSCLRVGKLLRHPGMQDNEYYSACWVKTFINIETNKEYFSIAKVNKKDGVLFSHPDMSRIPLFFNLTDILSEKWEAFDNDRL